MASTYTSRIRLEKQGDGENANTWGLRLNENVIDLIDEAISGYEEIDLSGGSVTLTANNGSADQARNFGLRLTGAITSNVTVTVPAQEKIYFISNQTTGDYDVFIKNAGGTAVSVVDQGFSSIVASDGTSVTNFNEPDLSGLATTSALADTSATLNTRISTVSATMATSIANVSSTLESRIATVSSTMATSIANVSSTLETRVATVSSTLETRIATVSATMATSISNVKASVAFATSASFAASATNATKVYISGTGSSGSYRVALADTSNASGHYSLYKDSGGQFYYNPSSNQLNVGSVVASGELTAFSDKRLKENVKTLDGSKAFEMRGVSFIKDGKESSGVIAQEIEEVAPELITESGGYKSVAYGNVVGYLIEAVKLLKEEIEEVKSSKCANCKCENSD